MILTEAHQQWLQRPDDEKFWTIDDLFKDAQDQNNRSREARNYLDNFKVVPRGKKGLILASGKGEADISNYAFGQLAQRIGFSGSELQKLNSNLASEVINYMIQRFPKDDENRPVVNAYIEQEEGRLNVRAINSDTYTRIPDSLILPYIKELTKRGWRVPPARPTREDDPRARIATKEDVLAFGKGGIQVKVGDQIAPAGLYRGDRDMFVFLVNDSAPVYDAFGHPLMPGAFFVNSEVGFASFRITRFLMDGVCGNLIAWNVSNVINVKYKHTTNCRQKILESITPNLLEEGTKSIEPFVELLNKMSKAFIAKSKDDVISDIYDARVSQVFTKKLLGNAYDVGVKHKDTDGHPNTWRGFTAALTRFSQTVPYANERNEIDMAVGKLYDIASNNL